MFFEKLFKPKAIDLVAPMNGLLIPIEQVNDPVFSEKTMGDGFAIKFTDGNVYSPVNGEVIVTFPTNHAVGIKAEDRNDILIHIGLDTVLLKGEGLKVNVKVGDKVRKGDLLVEVDHDFFAEKGVDMTSPVLITNLNGRTVRNLKLDVNVNVGDGELIAIKV